MALFLPHLHLRQYKNEEVVFFRNDPSNAFYIVKSGKVSLNIDVNNQFEVLMVLKSGGRFCLIEQASDNSKVGRPKVEEYLHAFEELECLQHYPIRNGRWWLLYLIRYGLIPEKWFPRIATHELKRRREEKGSNNPYQDFVFLFRK